MVWKCVGARLVSGDKIRLSVEEFGRKYLLELARAALALECVGTRLLELWQV